MLINNNYKSWLVRLKTSNVITKTTARYSVRPNVVPNLLSAKSGYRLFFSDAKIHLDHKSPAAYQELIQSIPARQRSDVEAELDSEEISSEAASLCENFTNHADANQILKHVFDDTRNLFLSALRNVRDNKISVAQLASLHLLDSAIRTLYTNILGYMTHNFVDDFNNHDGVINIFPLKKSRGLPSAVESFRYDTILLPKPKMSLDKLPRHMREPVMKQFFNFSVAEWDYFSKKMSQALPSEQFFNVLIAPESGCWSNIIFRIQSIVSCMQVLQRMKVVNKKFHEENIMLVPSFSMFQAALDTKALTLGRKSVELVPTYGYLEDEHYAKLKMAGKIAMAMYLPEKNVALRYQDLLGGFRTRIDGHQLETAFAGAIHDIYHALREMMMSEQVARARMRLAEIAKRHPNNKFNVQTTPIDEILIDGELIYSYPLSVDTIFNHKDRPPRAQSFGQLFYTHAIKGNLHRNLKRAFIEDMVVNEELWMKEYGIGKSDLRKTDQRVYEKIRIKLAIQKDGDVVVSKAGMWAVSKGKKKGGNEGVETVEMVKTNSLGLKV